MENVNVDPKKFIKKVEKNKDYNNISIIDNGNGYQQIKWMIQNVQQNIATMLNGGSTKKSVYFGLANNGMVPDDISINDYEKKIIEESQIIGNFAIEKFNKAYDGTGLSFKAIGKCQKISNPNQQRLFSAYVELEILIDEKVVNSTTAKPAKKIEDNDEE